MNLGVNIDHIATLRELRKAKEPEPILAAGICELAGADSIVVHLREDRRHITERDLTLLRQVVKTKLNLEMSINKEIVEIACKVAPDQVTLVPERRQELTTEGGLDVVGQKNKIKDVIKVFHAEQIPVSLFIEPNTKHIDIAHQIKADMVELHTGTYANSKNQREYRTTLRLLQETAQHAKEAGLVVNAGHGLDYNNVIPLCGIRQIREFNIGYSIICRAVIVGLDRAVREMKNLIDRHKL